MADAVIKIGQRRVTVIRRGGTGPAGGPGPAGPPGDGSQFFSVRDYGAVGNNIANDLPAFEATLAAIKANGGGTMWIPAGKYYLADTLNLHQRVTVRGEGMSSDYATGTILRFGKNKNGIVVNAGNTHGDGLGTQGNAQNSTIEELTLWGGNANANGDGSNGSFAAGDSPNGHGVRIRTIFVTLRNVSTMFFGGDGFNIVCYAGSGGEAEGNANSFYLETCQATYNGRHGLYIEGADANAGTTTNFSAITNAGVGLWDQSFLGNQHNMPHTRDNGYVDPTGTGGSGGGGLKPVGTCSYGGQAYYVVAGQEAAASTAQPGTNSNVWRPQPSAHGISSLRPWVSGLTWILGGAYAALNVNARNVFVCPYAEAGQAPVQAIHPSMFIGGLLTEIGEFSPPSSAGRIYSETAGIRGNAYTVFDGEYGTGRYSRFGNRNPEVWTEHHNSVALWSIQELAGSPDRIGMFRGGAAVFQMHHVNNDEPVRFRPSALWLGSPNGNTDDPRSLHYIDGLADLTGRQVYQGNRYYYRGAVPGGKEGLVCTTSGVVGSGAVLKEFGSIVA